MRPKQKARKCSYVVAPRRQVMAFVPLPHPPVTEATTTDGASDDDNDDDTEIVAEIIDHGDNIQEEDLDVGFVPFQAEGGLNLGFDFSGTNEANDISEYDIFDLDDQEVVEEYLPGYTVSRQAIFDPQLFCQDEINLIEDARTWLSKKCGNSTHAICYLHDNGTIGYVSELDNKESVFNHQVLNQMLQDGKIYGCDLRGNKETGQFGLVANMNLSPGTPVAVEGGRILPKWYHEEMIQEMKDPMLGLASNEIPIKLLKMLATRKYREKYSLAFRKGELAGKEEGFVVDCSSYGNETKHIDDPSWLSAGSNMPVQEPNLEAFLIINLQQGSPPFTVGFFVKDGVHVKKGEELFMDWGCWRAITEKLLPGQVMLSIAAKKKLDNLQNQLEKKGFEKILPPSDSEMEQLEQHFFNSTDLDKLMEGGSSQHDFGNRFKLLHDAYYLIENTNESNAPREKRLKLTKYEDYHELTDGEIDYKSSKARFAVRPTEETLLSTTTRRRLDKVKGTSVDKNLRILLEEEDLSSRVEVVEIVDNRNPALLLSIPGQKAYGVIAKRNFKADEAVIVYGGLLIDDDSSIELQHDSYLFETDTKDLLGRNFKKHLSIWGRESVGGKINDSVSLGKGTNNRDANLGAVSHFDGKSKNPQIVLYALRDILEGEELLYDYGINYWKIMWKNLMMDHASFTAETNWMIEQAKIKLQSQSQEEKSDQSSSSDDNDDDDDDSDDSDLSSTDTENTNPVDVCNAEIPAHGR